MSDQEQPRNPLHGLTLEQLLTDLVEHYGWEGLAQRIALRCFAQNPSIASSLKVLRKMIRIAKAYRITSIADFVASRYGKSPLLAALDEYGEPVAQVRVRPDFKLNSASATRWIENDFAQPS